MINLLKDYPGDLELVFDGGRSSDGLVLFVEVNEVSPAFDDTMQEQVVLISDGIGECDCDVCGMDEDFDEDDFEEQDTPFPIDITEFPN